MTRRIPAILGVAAAAALVLAGCTSAPHATASSSRPTASPSASATMSAADAKLATGTRLVAQEGLAIALASNVLQTNLLLVEVALSDDDPPMSCTALPGGAGGEQLSAFGGSAASRTITQTVYYDAGCTKPYLVADATVGNDDDERLTATASVVYTAPSGTKLGTLTTSANASLSDAGVDLEGTGTFARDGQTPVSLGLACQSVSDSELDCQGGIAQDFAALATSIGSITPLQLAISSDFTGPVTFQGSGDSYAIAKPGALGITSPDGAHLAISGAATTAGAITTSGQAGGLVFFPPTPTGWTVTDAADDIAFTIGVTDDATRDLTATVTQLSTKKTLAALALDESGTGTITYAGQKPAPVTSWMLTR